MENEDANQPERLPFPRLDQVDSDFAMALALQEQERAFSVLETIESDDDDEEVSYERNNNDYAYEYFEEEEEEGNDDEDMEEEFNEIDPDDLSYEELIALGEIIGVEKRGLSENEISSCLVPCKFQSVECKAGIDRCAICQVEYEEEEEVVALPNCDHPYHLECISKWLQIKKICPICNTEISSSKNARNVL